MATKIVDEVRSRSVDRSLDAERAIGVTEPVHAQAHDCVAALIQAIDSGRVKGKQFSKEIEDFEPEELGRLSEELLYYYYQKFR